MEVAAFGHAVGLHQKEAGLEYHARTDGGLAGRLKPESMRGRHVAASAGTHHQDGIAEAACGQAHEPLSKKGRAVHADVGPGATPDLLPGPGLESHDAEREGDHELVAPAHG